MTRVAREEDERLHRHDRNERDAARRRRGAGERPDEEQRHRRPEVAADEEQRADDRHADEPAPRRVPSQEEQKARRETASRERRIALVRVVGDHDALRGEERRRQHARARPGEAPRQQRREAQRRDAPDDVRVAGRGQVRPRELSHAEDVKGQGRPVPGQSVVEEADLTADGEPSGDQVLHHVAAGQKRPGEEEPLPHVARGDQNQRPHGATTQARRVRRGRGVVARRHRPRRL